MTAIAGVILTYINWRILTISRDIYTVSKDLLDVNLAIHEVSKELLVHTITLQEKILGCQIEKLKQGKLIKKNDTRR